MTTETSRSWVAVAASTILTALAGAVALLAGLAVLFLLPATVVIVAFSFAELWSTGGALGWVALLWFPFAFAAAFYIVVAGLAATGEPSLGRLLRLLLVGAIAFLSFPPFWLPG